MLALAGKPNSALLFENVDLGAPSMTDWTAGSGLKRTLPAALNLTASHISWALAPMPFSSMVRRGPILSDGRASACRNDCTTFLSEMQASRVSGATGHT